MAFEMYRGTNVSHWLSQSDARGEARRKRFTRDDVQRLASMGFDHLRLPVDEEQLWNLDGGRESEAWDLLQEGLDWCREADLRAIVDLHILRSHHFNTKAEKALFTDPAAGERFGQCWVELSEELESRSNDWVAYELLNEAVADDPEDWNRLLKIPYKVVRNREPERVIALGSNRWCQVQTFPDFKVPEGDPNIILVFHYYNPMLITHYQADWCASIGDYDGPIGYPGRPVAEEDIRKLEPGLRERVIEENCEFTVDTIDQQLQPALKRAEELNLKLWCNEFGVVANADDTIRLRWYHDFLSILDKYEIPWTNWDMRGGFGIFDSKTNRTTVVAEGLLGKR